MSPLNSAWANALTPADGREIWEWIAEEGEFPTVYAMPGRLDISTCPMIRGPLRALKNPIVRKVTCMCGVQCLKTLVGEMWLLWSIPNSPGPSQWLHPDDQEALEHAKERFIPLIENYPTVHRYFTENRHDQSTGFIRFKHMFLRMEGALGKGNLQRKSIMNQMRSEVWQKDKWIPGRLKEAEGRQMQFVHNSKAYTESQPGWDAAYNIDDMHPEYLAGSQTETHFRCLGCGKLQPFLWTHRRADGTEAAMRWDETPRTRRESGEWRWGELIQTIRYECIYCGNRHHDQPLERRRITATLEDVPQNPDADPAHESYNWGQLAMPNLNWFETKIGGVKNYLIAHEQARRGYDQPLMDFWMKVVGHPYNPAKHAAVAAMETIEVDATSKPGEPLVFDGVTFSHLLGAIDVQEDWFRLVIEAFSATGDQITLWMSTEYSWDDVATQLEKFKVPEANVSVDVSHRGHEVKLECCKHGYWARAKGGPLRWRCWKALRGSDQDAFIWTKRINPQKVQKIQLPYTWPPEVGDPAVHMKPSDPRRADLRGKTCEVITWSNPTIKDIAINRRDGKAMGVKVLVSSGPWNDQFNLEMHSQKKVLAPGRWGGGKWKWQKFRDDHSLDCRCMNLVRAFQLGLIAPRAEEEN